MRPNLIFIERWIKNLLSANSFTQNVNLKEYGTDSIDENSLHFLFPDIDLEGDIVYI